MIEMKIQLKCENESPEQYAFSSEKVHLFEPRW